MVRRRTATVWLTTVGLTAVLCGVQGSSALERQEGSLSVSPGRYVPGQRLTFAGSLPGERQSVHLQFNMNRPGDVWTDVDGSHGTTDGSGHFKLSFPAPAMMNISYRVVSGHNATRGVLLDAGQPDVGISVSSGGSELPRQLVVAGQHYTVSARATSPFPGRAVTLQQRVHSDQWRTIAHGKENSRGRARFNLTAPSVAGELVFRVRDENYYKHGNKIGWIGSFPMPVTFAVRPAAITGLAVADVATTSIGLQWNKATDPKTSNLILAYNTGTTPPSDLRHTDGQVKLDGSATSATISRHLSPDTSYAFALFSQSDQRLLSATADTLTTRTAPVPPVTALTATGSLDTRSLPQVALAWQPPKDDGAKRIVVVRTSGATPPATPGDGEQLDTLKASATGFTDQDVDYATTYSYSVFATFDGRIRSAASSVTATTPSEPPPSNPQPNPAHRAPVGMRGFFDESEIR